jgi:hypothetical protein
MSGLFRLSFIEGTRNHEPSSIDQCLLLNQCLTCNAMQLCLLSFLFRSEMRQLFAEHRTATTVEVAAGKAVATAAAAEAAAAANATAARVARAQQERM